MKNNYKKIILTFLSIALGLNTFGQISVLKESIYFESAKFYLTKDSKKSLDNLIDSLKTYQAYKIFIKGNTDNLGDSLFNLKLSEQRVSATKQYFILKGISPTVFSTFAFGEEKPIADNETEKGKQKNRRVDISISFTRPILKDSSEFLESIFELYKQTERKPQEFCIDNTRDTFLRCEQGTIVKIKANTFKKSKRKCRNECITFEVKEDFLQSDMILDNLATTSNGKIIETQGMLYLNAKDCNGNDLEIVRGRDLLIFQPSDTIIEDAKIFTGNRTGHDSDMNWTVNNTSVLSGFTMERVQTCNDWICGLGYQGDCRCKFLFCRVKRLPDAILGLFIPCVRYTNRKIRNEIRICKISDRLVFAKSREKEKRIARLEEKLNRKQDKRQKLIDKYSERCDLTPSGLPVADLPSPCKRLYELFKQYGVNNYEELFYQLNKAQMDRFGVDNMKDLQDSLRAATRRGIEENYKSKNIAFEDMKYYVYNTSRLGWSNVDVFVNIKPEDMVTMTVNIKALKNTDCKLVFRDRQFVIPAETEAGIYQFKNMPKGERVWIVTLMYANGQPFLSMEETKIDDGIHSVSYELLTLEELKEKLKLLNQ